MYNEYTNIIISRGRPFTFLAMGSILSPPTLREILNHGGSQEQREQRAEFVCLFSTVSRFKLSCAELGQSSVKSPAKGELRN